MRRCISSSSSGGNMERRLYWSVQSAGMPSDGRRTIVITGAGGALGAALSARFAGEPDTDLVLSDVSAASLEATMAGLPTSAGGAVETALADVSDFDQVASVVDLAIRRFGRLDVLISNAGVLS